MKNLYAIANLCIRNLNAIGIYPNEVVEFKVNSRAKRRFGQASYNSLYDEYTIEINSILLRDDCPEKALLETLYHELLHCVDGCMNHGKEWQELADLVSDCYMVNISRTNTLEDKYGKEYAKIVRNEQQSDKKEYRCYCSDCGQVYKRVGYRAPKWYTHTDNYFCTPCRNKGLSGKLVKA